MIILQGLGDMLEVFFLVVHSEISHKSKSSITTCTTVQKSALDELTELAFASDCQTQID